MCQSRCSGVEIVCAGVRPLKGDTTTGKLSGGASGPFTPPPCASPDFSCLTTCSPGWRFQLRFYPLPNIGRCPAKITTGGEYDAFTDGREVEMGWISNPQLLGYFHGGPGGGYEPLGVVYT